MSGVIVLVLRIVLIALLYAFLGWAFYVLWKDLRAQGNLVSSPPIPAIILTPVGQPDQESRSFDTPEVVLGRSSTNEYPIPNDTVSVRHARLSYHHNQWWLEDLNSTNGTFLNDERVAVATVIMPGDELRVGNLNLLIGIGEKDIKKEA